MKKGTASMDTAITIKTIIAMASCIAMNALANSRQSAGNVQADPAVDLLKEARRINASAKADGLSLESERRILSDFEKLTYATLPVSMMRHEVDFSARLECLREIAGFGIVKSETNLLATAQAAIMKLDAMSTQSMEKDLKEARDILIRLCHTQKEIDEFESFVPDGKHMRGALLVHPAYAHWVSAIASEYDARERYNNKLSDYKSKAVSVVANSLTNAAPAAVAPPKENSSTISTLH